MCTKRFSLLNWLGFSFLAVGVGFMVWGCTKTIYVPVQRTASDSVVNRRVRADTVAIKDSIFFGMRGDTVVREVYRWRVKSRLRIDTVYKTRVDTVPVVIAPAQPAKSVKAAKAEKELPTWRKVLQWVVYATRVGFACLLVYVFYPVLRSIFLTVKSLLLDVKSLLLELKKRFLTRK